MAGDFSKTCRGSDGRWLREYLSEWEARVAAEETKEANPNMPDLVPYECPECYKWHLGRADRMTPSSRCESCNKQAYETKEAAELRAKILQDEQGVTLYTYSCEHGSGWHLTRKAG